MTPCPATERLKTILTENGVPFDYASVDFDRITIKVGSSELADCVASALLAAGIEAKVRVARYTPGKWLVNATIPGMGRA